MKKIIAAILTVVICIVFITGCDVSVVEANMSGRFKIEHAEAVNLYDELTVISDSETGVMYLIYDGDDYDGGITVMVDENGKPLISDEYSVE